MLREFMVDAKILVAVLMREMVYKGPIWRRIDEGACWKGGL